MSISRGQGAEGLTPISIGDPDAVQSWPFPEKERKPWDSVKVVDRRGQSDIFEEAAKSPEPNAGASYLTRDSELEKAVKRTELIKSKMSPPGALGLPPLLDAARLAIGIPDDAWRYQAVFDRIHIFQVDLEVKEEKFTGSSLYKPARTQQIAKEEAHTGILISAGLKAMDELMSHGIELGDKVGFLRNAPFRHLFARFDEFDMHYLVLRAGDITSNESLAERLRAGRSRILDEGGEYNYVHNIEGKKKKSVFISEHW